MADSETLSERVSAVERAMTEGEKTLPDAEAVAELEPRVADVEDRLALLDERVTELEAATQALRGYVGSVKSVNEDVEQRADAALAAVDRLEDRLESRQTPREPDPQPDATGSTVQDRPATQQRSRRAEGGRSSEHREQSLAPNHDQIDGLADVDQTETPQDSTSQDADGVRPPRTVGDESGRTGGSHRSGEDQTRAGVLARIRSLL
ncbi:DUF7310 family coiled-coil domain-containing protein [Haloarcula sp. GH36]|uniref:DUF7310 family coiled-coil domain-containing protein n=1 Tax=Haloarcula montana TaxID=3111776 RepID=UPI002D780124|nr:hypothetical protein [Haloarcula sp. GH36]